MTTSDFLHQNLNAELIAVHLDVSSRKKLFEKMAHLLTLPLNQNATENELEAVKEKDIYHQLWEREKLGNTGIGNGVAIPHSRCPQADKAIIAIITMNEAIDYDSLDRQPVDVAFGLLVPTQATQEHLNLLADIARIMSNNEHKAALLAADTATQIIDLIGIWSS